MRLFLSRLLSGDESGVDSVVVGGFASLFVLFGMTVYAGVHDPATWSPVSFVTAAGGIIATFAGGKTVRDRLSQAPAPGAPQ